MKLLPSLLFLLSSIVLAGTCDVPVVLATQAALFKGKEPDWRLSDCKPLPGSKATYAALLTFENVDRDKDVRTYDVELLLIDSVSGRVSARLSRTRVWESAGYKIGSAAILANSYPLASGVKAFGVVESWGGSSTIAAYDMTKLSLYVPKGQVIVPALEELVTYIYKGEAEPYRKTERKITLGPAKEHGLRDLHVSERVFNETCVSAGCVDTLRRGRSYVLSSRAGKYAMPKRLKPFGDVP